MAIETKQEFIVTGESVVVREQQEVTIDGVKHVLEVNDGPSYPVKAILHNLSVDSKVKMDLLKYAMDSADELQDKIIALVKATGDNGELAKLLDKYTLEMQTLVEQFELKIDYLQTEKGKLPK